VIRSTSCLVLGWGFQGRIQDLKLVGVKCGLGGRVPKALAYGGAEGADMGGVWRRGIPSPVEVGSGEAAEKFWHVLLRNGAF